MGCRADGIPDDNRSFRSTGCIYENARQYHMEVAPCEAYPEIGVGLRWMGAPLGAGDIICYLEGTFRMRRGRRVDGKYSLACTINGIAVLPCILSSTPRVLPWR
jgi:hypothetical protein